MTTLTEGATPGDFVLYETPSHYCRAAVTIASGADLGAGTVLGIVTASGKYAASDEAETNGTEVAKAVLLEDAAAAAADVQAVVLLRGPAQLRRGGLVFDASYDSEAKRDAAIAELETAGIVTIA